MDNGERGVEKGWGVEGWGKGREGARGGRCDMLTGGSVRGVLMMVMLCVQAPLTMRSMRRGQRSTCLL